MSKTIRKVFMIVGTLVLVFLIWQLVFNNGGIIKTGYNAIASGINTQWGKAAGEGNTLIPLWEDTDATEDANGKGFSIDTK